MLDFRLTSIGRILFSTILIKNLLRVLDINWDRIGGVSASIGLLLSAKYVNLLKVFNGVKISYVYIGIMTFLLFTIYHTGQIYFAGLSHLIIAVCLLPFGLLLIKKDPTPLVFGFILHQPLCDSWIRLVELYF